MGFSNSSLITNTQENKTLKDQIERERYEHRRALMNQEDKTFLEVIKPLEEELEEKVELLDEVKSIYGEENNNWEDEENFLDACRDRERVFEKFHEGTLVEQEEVEKVEDKLEASQIKEKSLDILVYGIGWDQILDICDKNTQERLIELGHFIKDDFAR